MEKTTQLTPFEQIREEFCSRYGLSPEQISFEIQIKDVSKELAVEICRDYERRPISTGIGENAAYTWNDDYWLFVHYKKEGEEDAES